MPNKFRRDRPLGRWVTKMRDLYCYDQLDADRRKALSDVGFVWKPPISAEPPKTLPSGDEAPATTNESGSDETDEESGTEYL